MDPRTDTQTDVERPAVEPAGGDVSPALRGRSARRSATPGLDGRVGEVGDVVHERQRVVVVTAIAVSILGMILAAILPDLLPPRPLVGAAVGLAAIVIGVAVALTLDASDAVVRGPRHVRAAGATLIDSGGGTLAGLVRHIDLQSSSRARRVAILPVGRDLPGVPAFAREVATRLAARDRRVLLADLSRPVGDGQPGLAEVAAGGASLGQAVEFDPEVMLARIGPGADLASALGGLPRLATRLPSDIELLVVVLPPLAHPGVLAATDGLDELVLVAAPDRTARIELVASLDAAEAAGIRASVVLTDTGAAPVRAVPHEPAAQALAEPLSAPTPSTPIAPEAGPPEAGPLDAGAPQAPPAGAGDEPVAIGSARIPSLHELLADEEDDADEGNPIGADDAWAPPAVAWEAEPTPAQEVSPPPAFEVAPAAALEPEPVVGPPTEDQPRIEAASDPWGTRRQRGVDPDRTDEMAPLVLDVTAPAVGPADDEPDALQVTVALHTLAQEVWGRDDRG